MAHPDPPRFTPLEWLALLPARPPPNRLPAWAAPPAPDPAAALRREDPLTASRLAALLSPYPPLRRYAKMRAALAPYAKYTYAHMVLGGASKLALLSVPWAFGRGTFGTRQLVASTVAVALWQILTIAWGTVTGIVDTRYQADMQRGNFADGDTKGDREDEAGPSDTMDYDDLAQIARWFQLASEDGGGVLLEHRERDRWCPCTRPGCLGTEPPRILASTILAKSAVFIGWWTSIIIFQCYTQLVTLAASTWTTAWSAAVAGITLALWGTYLPLVGIIFDSTVKTLPILAVENRLEMRAFSVALGSLVERFEAAVAASDSDQANTTMPPVGDLHTTLDRALAPTLRERFATYRRMRSFTGGVLLVELLSAITYVAGSSCLPLWCILGLALWFSISVVDLATVASANGKVDALVSLHLAARSRLRSLLLDLGPRAPELRLKIQDTEAVLDQAIAEAGHLRAKVAGVPVTMGVIRTAAATVLTVVVALFGLLRGLGVGFSVGNVCHSAD
ncbi:hypothetical protein DFJ74DRAFT_767773 [Hyaloraphidium curvatum]|nr:hypothetical protein DFJ74DRAFT_767773 [Hyaloraphidium curvatum]